MKVDDKYEPLGIDKIAVSLRKIFYAWPDSDVRGGSSSEDVRR